MTTTKKTTPKKKPTTKHSSKKGIFSNPLLWQSVSVLLLSLTVGMFFGGRGATFSEIPENTRVKLDKNNEFIVYDNKTWIPVEGHPVTLTVLNDETCGTACNPAQTISSLRQGITPAMIIKEIDVASNEGQALLEKFEIKGVPSYVFEKDIEKLNLGGKKFIEQAKEVLIKKDDQYLIDNSKTGFKYGKFISGPTFDLENEPKLGNGPVTVVEFTDLQCPFCKRLHDQNKALIKDLISQEKITYVVKDFPLGFHKEAMPIHKAANCVLETDGNEKYFAFLNEVFKNQQNWSGKSNVVDLAKNYAKTAGATTEGLQTCIAETSDEEIKADMQEGSSYGVSGTPALFIGSQVMPGAIGPDAFKAAVEAELKK